MRLRGGCWGQSSSSDQRCRDWTAVIMAILTSILLATAHGSRRLRGTDRTPSSSRVFFYCARVGSGAQDAQPRRMATAAKARGDKLTFLRSYSCTAAQLS